MMCPPSGLETDPASSQAFRLRLVYRLDELNRLATWIETVASQLSLTERAKFRLEMVLTEAVTNVIQHGSEGAGDREIRLVLEQAGDDVRMEVRDGGRPFDPLEQPRVVFPRTLDEASQGGLGIHLIRSYSDECSYRHEGGENVLTLIIRDVKQQRED